MRTIPLAGCRSVSTLASSLSWAHRCPKDIIGTVVDFDGLQVAYLGVVLAHYLDLETGDTLDIALDSEPPGSAGRYGRIPTRTPETEDRRLFLDKRETAPLRDALSHAPDDAHVYRAILSEDRRIERSFLNFKTDRATQAIQKWLESEGIS